MASFRGILQVEGDLDSDLIADVDISHGEMTIRAGGTAIGRWELNDITVEESKGGFRIVAEDEALFFQVGDAKRFANSVGIGLSPSFAADHAAPVVTPTPTKRAPSEGPSVLDEPIEAPPAPPVPPPPEPKTRVDETAGPDETPLARHLSWSLVGAAVLLFVGALLDWGSVRLTNANFPIARLLVVVAAFAAGAAAYLGLALEKRRDVALVALLGGLIAVLVVIAYARRADIGYGFIVTILGVVAVVSTAILALSHLGAPKEPDG